MSSLELSISHGRMKDDELIPFSENILICLSGNAQFTVAKERLDLIRTRLTDYQQKLGTSKGGSKLDTIKKNDSKTVLSTLLDDLAVDLCVQAKGDRTKLVSTGFQLVKEPERHKQPTKPTSFKVNNGVNSGELIFTVAPCSMAHVYVFYYTTAPAAQSDPTTWKYTISTKHRLVIPGFSHGAEYECCCAYQGTDGKMIFSDVVKAMAL